jgi:hypothetical protein
MLGPRPESTGNPRRSQRQIYVTAGSRRDIVAPDAESGEMLWL